MDQQLKVLFGMGFDQMKVLHPVMINNMIAISLYNKLNKQQIQSDMMDLYFQRIAKESNKSVLGLESLEDQIQVLFGLSSIEKQVQDLLCTIQNLEYSEGIIKEIDTYYREGNLEALALLEDDFMNPCPSTQEEKDALNKMRNNKWLVKLPAIMSAKSSFIAVGCLHLVGYNGLLVQLRKMGYTVEEVK